MNIFENTIIGGYNNNIWSSGMNSSINVARNIIVRRLSK